MRLFERFAWVFFFVLCGAVVGALISREPLVIRSAATLGAIIGLVAARWLPCIDLE